MEERQVFIGQEIRVGYRNDQIAQKSPACPDYFIWEEKSFAIAQLEQEWKDFSRKGSAGRNMRPAHLDRAQTRGSWGVGRFYFRVRTECGRVFFYILTAPRRPVKTARGSGSCTLNMPEMDVTFSEEGHRDGLEDG